MKKLGLRYRRFPYLYKNYRNIHVEESDFEWHHYFFIFDVNIFNVVAKLFWFNGYVVFIFNKYFVDICYIFVKTV